MGHTLVVRVVFIIFSWEQATGLAEKIALNDPEDGVYGDIGAPGLPPNGEEREVQARRFPTAGFRRALHTWSSR